MDRISLNAARRRSRRLLLGGALALVAADAARAAESIPTDDVGARDAALLESFRRSREALEWTDALVRHDWRLQRHAAGADWRIVDPHERTVLHGSAAECRRRFTGLEQDGTIPPVRGKVLILLHGLGEDRGSMQPLAEHLRGILDATVLTFGYASVRHDIDAHGRSLADVIDGLPEATRISFVGHSLGNLVVRRWMALAAQPALARVHRMVMLGPPNQGSELARMAAGLGLAGRFEGAARDLVDWRRVAPLLAVPPCDFGIIAGGRGDAAGYSQLLEGDDDAVVRVEETRLDGAEDFLVVPVHHAAMMHDPAVRRATIRFLESGRFAAADRAEPARQ
jgi:hypothetical protein